MKTLRKFAVAFLAILGISAAVDVAATTYYKTIVPNTQFKGYVLFEQDVIFQGAANLVSAAEATLGDLTVTDDATIGDDLAVTGDVAVTGTTTLTGGIVNGSNLNTTANKQRIYTGTKTLTEAGGAETIFTLTTATTQASGGTLFWTIKATDATDYATRSGKTTFSCVNVGGTTAGQALPADQTDDPVGSSNSKTLTYAVALATGANTCAVTFDIDSDMTTTANSMEWTLILAGPGTVS